MLVFTIQCASRDIVSNVESRQTGEAEVEIKIMRKGRKRGCYRGRKRRCVRVCERAFTDNLLFTFYVILGLSSGWLRHWPTRSFHPFLLRHRKKFNRKGFSGCNRSLHDFVLLKNWVAHHSRPSTQPQDSGT